MKRLLRHASVVLTGVLLLVTGSLSALVAQQNEEPPVFYICDSLDSDELSSFHQSLQRSPAVIPEGARVRHLHLADRHVVWVSSQKSPALLLDKPVTITAFLGSPTGFVEALSRDCKLPVSPCWSMIKARQRDAHFDVSSAISIPHFSGTL